MRVRTVLTVLATVTGLLAPAGTAAAAQGGHDRSQKGPTYYVSLGDSLASGYQPDTGTDTDQSYTDKLYEQLRKEDPRLVHIKLGCSGERSTTMLKGGTCTYTDRHGRKVSQLAKAVDFLRRHRARVRYVTVGIGANDVGGCVSDGTIDTRCTVKGLRTLQDNLPEIAFALRRSTGRHTRLAAMTYYNPYLAAWLTGEQGRDTAVRSAVWQQVLNAVITSEFRRRGFAVADVSRAFDSLAFSPKVPLPGTSSRVPLNVARICQYTWMCTPYTDIHANPAGHELIADTFAARMR